MNAFTEQVQTLKISDSEKITTEAFNLLSKGEQTQVRKLAAANLHYASPRDYVSMVLRGERYKAEVYTEVRKAIKSVIANTDERLKQVTQKLKELD